MGTEPIGPLVACDTHGHRTAGIVSISNNIKIAPRQRNYQIILHLWKCYFPQYFCFTRQHLKGAVNSVSMVCGTCSSNLTKTRNQGDSKATHVEESKYFTATSTRGCILKS